MQESNFSKVIESTLFMMEDIAVPFVQEHRLDIKSFQ